MCGFEDTDIFLLENSSCSPTRLAGSSHHTCCALSALLPKMYSIITTEGFIIDSRPSGEAGKLLYIFTKDHGLVMATAQGIRLEKSKLRYFIQDYSFGVYSFVKGKEYWRLTNAQ